MAFAQSILDYIVANGHATAEDGVAKQASQWGFELEEDATVEDFALAIGEQYGWSFSAMEKEAADKALSDLMDADVYND